MLSLKKVYRDELLQLALILSLLRVNNEPYFDNDIYGSINYDLDNGTSWRSITPSMIRSQFLHPKSLDSVLLNYERDLFADLNSLGRYNRNSFRHPDVTAYLLNIERNSAPQNTPDTVQDIPNVVVQPDLSEQNAVSSSSNEASSGPIDVGLELTQEDMDLIEVLWKQDVDLGFTLDTANPKPDKLDENEAENVTTLSSPTTSLNNEEIEKLKTLKSLNSENENLKGEEDGQEEDPTLDDPWAGLDYTIDTETGEYVIKGDLNETHSGADGGPSSDLALGDLSLPLPEFLLDEALRFVDLDEDSPQGGVNAKEIENGSLNSSATETNLPSSTVEQAIPGPSTGNPSNSTTKDSDSELDLIADMIQTSHFNHPSHRAFQSRMPYVRTMSMEQRWQDLANLLSLPAPADPNAMSHPFSHHHALHNYSHPHAHSMGYGSDRGVLLHNATLTPPMGDINGTVPYSNIGGTNLGNAVATSMNLTNSSEPMGESSSATHYKLEPSHDIMYYQNGTSDLNQTDGFLSSILNDEDLQLVDMAMNEGMYTMRMLDNNNGISNLSMSGAAGTTSVSRTDADRMDTSSDSAVSSMGSERVPSLSDGEWCDAGSDSGHTPGDHYVTDYHNKYRPYDYSYNTRQPNTGMSSSESRITPVAQKKHHLYGKRVPQEHGSTSAVVHHSPHSPVKYEYRDNITSSYNSSSQAEGAIGPKPPEMKYSCSLEFGRHSHLARNSIDHIQHNHTYHLPAESTGAMQRPVSRDKPKGRKSEDEHLTRDEKRARALNVPISVDDIINLPMDEFNERLSKYDLSEPQLSLIRDIRRRGKNKVAAQNCRKRKLDQILSLADEVKEMRDRKSRLTNEHDYVIAESKRMNKKYQQLYIHVFQNLRDVDGNPYSPHHYSLQTSADGTILIVPRSRSTLANPDHKDLPSQNYKE